MSSKTEEKSDIMDRIFDAMKADGGPVHPYDTIDPVLFDLGHQWLDASTELLLKKESPKPEVEHRNKLMKDIVAWSNERCENNTIKHTELVFLGCLIGIMEAQNEFLDHLMGAYISDALGIKMDLKEKE